MSGELKKWDLMGVKCLVDYGVVDCQVEWVPCFMGLADAGGVGEE